MALVCLFMCPSTSISPAKSSSSSIAENRVEEILIGALIMKTLIHSLRKMAYVRDKRICIKIAVETPVSTGKWKHG